MAILDIGIDFFLANLNFPVAPISPIEFPLNSIYGLEDVV